MPISRNSAADDVGSQHRYSWAQELFCDAVGSVIGGPAFAHAFSMHLQMLGRGHYHLPPDELARRVHPVTWLRVQLIAARARRMGFETDAEAVEKGWRVLAEAMGMIEDYYGFYIPQFLPAINQAIDDMLTETEPRRFSDEEVSGFESEPSISSPIRLLNQAWHEFRKDSEAYPMWERGAIEVFLRTDWTAPRS